MGKEGPNFDKLVQSLEEDDLSRFLTDIKPILLRTIFRIQLEEAGDDLSCAISKTKQVLHKMEAGVNALREHERLMDKNLFEECVKDDTFLVKGKDKKGQRPVWWVRAGHILSQNWRHKLGSPKAHAFIRAAMFQYQAAIARMLAEEEYGPDGPSFFIAFDQPLGGMIVFCGFSKLHKFLVNAFFMICPQKAKESAIVLNNEEEMDSLLVSARDKPHWFLKRDDKHHGKEEDEHHGKRRDPLDPREFWAYRRCIGGGKPLEFSDIYNPDPKTWLDGCETEVEVAPKAQGATISPSSLEVIEEHDEEDDGEGW